MRMVGRIVWQRDPLAELHDAMEDFRRAVREYEAELEADPDPSLLEQLINTGRAETGGRG
jgi:hypothetical protein